MDDGQRPRESIGAAAAPMAALLARRNSSSNRNSHAKAGLSRPVKLRITLLEDQRVRTYLPNVESEYRWNERLWPRLDDHFDSIGVTAGMAILWRGRPPMGALSFAGRNARGHAGPIDVLLTDVAPVSTSFSCPGTRRVCPKPQLPAGAAPLPEAFSFCIASGTA